MAILWIILVACAALLPLTPVAAVATEANTQYGRVRGVYEPKSNLVIYYGIPFAAPPVGNLRLQPPQVMGGLEDEWPVESGLWIVGWKLVD